MFPLGYVPRRNSGSPAWAYKKVNRAKNIPGDLQKPRDRAKWPAAIIHHSQACEDREYFALHTTFSVAVIKFLQRSFSDLVE